MMLTETHLTHASNMEHLHVHTIPVDAVVVLLTALVPEYISFGRLTSPVNSFLY